MAANGHGDDEHTSASITGRTDLTAHSDLGILLDADEVIKLKCGASEIKLTPEVLTIKVGRTTLGLRDHQLDIDSPTIKQTGGPLIDLQATRINLNSREGT